MKNIRLFKKISVAGSRNLLLDKETLNDFYDNLDKDNIVCVGCANGVDRSILLEGIKRNFNIELYLAYSSRKYLSDNFKSNQKISFISSNKNPISALVERTIKCITSSNLLVAFIKNNEIGKGTSLAIKTASKNNIHILRYNKL